MDNYDYKDIPPPVKKQHKKTHERYERQQKAKGSHRQVSEESADEVV